MCARVEIEVGKKRQGVPSLVLALREETVRASPLRLPGRGGRGGGRRNLFRSVLPAPPAHPRFPPLLSFLPSRGGGASRSSPFPPPPQCRATFAVPKLSHHVGAPDPRPAGRPAAPTGSRLRIPALASSPRLCRPCPRPCRRPLGPGEATLAAAAAPGPPGVLPRGPRRGGGGDAASGAAGWLRRWMSLPGCSALAERPGPPAHWARRGPCRLEACRAAASAGPSLRNSSTVWGTSLEAEKPPSSGALAGLRGLHHPPPPPPH